MSLSSVLNFLASICGCVKDDKYQVCTAFDLHIQTQIAAACRCLDNLLEAPKYIESTYMQYDFMGKVIKITSIHVSF